MKTEILPNGNLLLTLESAADREDVAEFGHEWERLFTDNVGGFSALVGNGWHTIPPEWIGALTDAPIVSNDVVLDDDGNPHHIGATWWFPNYMVECPVATLAEKGSVTFTLAPEVK